MRMWNVDPKVLCNKHLLGEHVECHMMLGSLKRGRSVKGHIDKGQYEIHNLNKRHSELVDEMLVRGMRHTSAIHEEDLLFLYFAGRVDIDKSLRDLSNRCLQCNENILKGGYL